MKLEDYLREILDLRKEVNELKEDNKILKKRVNFLEMIEKQTVYVKNEK